ncbi:hypothetical protein FB451DRAFT_1190873 [Mycena latifolia]|nr:hypothetical protein FB451DRAFT_1190873 [Mycena latifolia]
MTSPNLCAFLELWLSMFHLISSLGRDLVLYMPIWRPRTPPAVPTQFFLPENVWRRLAPPTVTPATELDSKFLRLLVASPAGRAQFPTSADTPADEARKLARLLRVQESRRRQRRWEQHPVSDMFNPAGLSIYFLCWACPR